MSEDTDSADEYDEYDVAEADGGSNGGSNGGACDVPGFGHFGASGVENLIRVREAATPSEATLESAGSIDGLSPEGPRRSDIRFYGENASNNAPKNAPMNSESDDVGYEGGDDRDDNDDDGDGDDGDAFDDNNGAGGAWCSDAMLDPSGANALMTFEAKLYRYFFGKVLAYAKPLRIVNYTSIQFHKTYKLVDRAFCRDCVALCRTTMRRATRYRGCRARVVVRSC